VTLNYTYKFVLPKLGGAGGVVSAKLSGLPVAGARVIATMSFEGKWLKSEATTSAKGQFALSGLPPGDWKVQARAEGLAHQSAQVHVDAERVSTVDLALDPPSSAYDILVEEQEDAADSFGLGKLTRIAVSKRTRAAKTSSVVAERRIFMAPPSMPSDGPTWRQFHAPSPTTTATTQSLAISA
jgi:hypothetical protein